MADEELKKSVIEWAIRIGKFEARRQLVVAGASPSTAHKLVNGRYTPEIRTLLGGAIMKAMRSSKAS